MKFGIQPGFCGFHVFSFLVALRYFLTSGPELPTATKIAVWKALEDN